MTSLQQTFDRHECRLRELVSKPDGEQSYQRLAIDLKVSEDDVIKLLRKAKSINQATELATSDQYEWPSLISMDAEQLPSLDLALFPTWMGAFARALSASTETPAELPGGMILAVVAAAAARRIVVRISDDYTEPTCLWVAPALEPANLKSAVESAAKEPLQIWESDQAEALAVAIRDTTSDRLTMDARIKALRSAAANVKTKAGDVQRYQDEIKQLESDLPDIPVPTRLWTSDATPETFGAMLGQHSECMALMSSEGAIIDILAGRYTGGTPNLDLFLKGHSGDSDVTDRLSRDSVKLKYPRITIGISPQPEVFNALASIKGGEGRGLLARFLYFLPASRLGYRTLDAPSIPQGVRTTYHAGVQAMLNWPANVNTANGCYEVELSPEARSEWQNFRQWVEVEMRPDGSMANHKKWAGKAAGAAIRIAGVMHSALHAHGHPWDTPIDVETMGAALEVVAVAIKHSRAVLSAMGSDEAMNNARTVLDWLRRMKLPSTTRRNIHAGVKHRLPTAKLVESAVDYLEERGYVYVVDQVSNPNNGRPGSPIVVVRPELVGGVQ